MTTTPAKIRRRKLADEVEERILAHIRTEKLKPGDTLPSERELMRLHGVGRPAIREAMQKLQRMGLVEIHHGERPRVAEASFETMAGQLSQTMRHLLSHNAATMEHLKEARVTFETEMARIAAQRQRPGDLVRIREIIARQEAQRGDPPRFLKCDCEFHTAIATISGNPIFASLSQALFEWLEQFHIDLVQKVGLEQQTLKEHREILSAIAENDGEKAARAMAVHLNRANALYHQDHFGK
jgi:DNA-binding FadR family transcriptional regulator